MPCRCRATGPVRACGQELQLSTLRPRRAAAGGRTEGGQGDDEEILAAGGACAPRSRPGCHLRCAPCRGGRVDSRDPAHPRRALPAAARRLRAPAAVTCLARRGKTLDVVTTHVVRARGRWAHRSWIWSAHQLVHRSLLHWQSMRRDAAAAALMSGPPPPTTRRDG